MDAFERNKFNESSFTKHVLANSTIVSYGFISAIDFNTVTVTLSVSDSSTAEKVTCTFMTLGNEHFSISLKPVINMRVLVLSPNKSAAGMYDSFVEMNAKQGRNYIFTGSPAIFSAQNAICIPIQKSSAVALSSLIIDDIALTAEIKQDLLLSLFSSLELDILGDTNIELHEGTEHFRGNYGNLTETFGMVEGASGTEKEGTYLYEETYGKYSTVKKNYESGADIVIGKSYETPFLEDKGELVDSSAPVTINFGGTAPVTLVFGESVITIQANTTDGIDIALTGSAKVNITAVDGKFNISNKDGSVKDILDKICELCAMINTIGGPAAQALVPDLVAKFSPGGELPVLIAKVFE
jgi:hypothetical protein